MTAIFLSSQLYRKARGIVPFPARPAGVIRWNKAPATAVGSASFGKLYRRRVETERFEYLVDIVLVEADIPACGFDILVVEYLAESNKGIGCTAQALVHIAAEGLAERVRRKPLDAELVFPEKVFQYPVDMLPRIWFPCARVTDDRQSRIGLAEQLVHLLIMFMRI